MLQKMYENKNQNYDSSNLGSSTIPVLGFVTNTFPGRTVERNFGKFYSLVLTGTCNARCTYCDVGGAYIDDRTNQFPGTYSESIEHIETFVRGKALKGNPLVISGGEPTLMPVLVKHLAKLNKQFGGYTAM